MYIVRSVTRRRLFQLPSKHEISIKKDCMVTVGRLSNLEHSKYKMKDAAESRHKGIKVVSIFSAILQLGYVFLFPVSEWYTGDMCTSVYIPF